jgi:hypothetical protein
MNMATAHLRTRLKIINSVLNTCVKIINPIELASRNIRKNEKGSYCKLKRLQLCQATASSKDEIEQKFRIYRILTIDSSEEQKQMLDPRANTGNNNKTSVLHKLLTVQSVSFLPFLQGHGL